MKKAHILLQHIIDIITTCIALYNTCTFGTYNFNIEWIEGIF